MIAPRSRHITDECIGRLGGNINGTLWNPPPGGEGGRKALERQRKKAANDHEKYVDRNKGKKD